MAVPDRVKSAMKRLGLKGVNKPKRLTSGNKSYVVMASYKEGGTTKYKVLRFGERGASVAGKPKAGESARMKAKRKSFKSRHAKNIARGPVSPAWWSAKYKW
jgi:hypothetical protein